MAFTHSALTSTPTQFTAAGVAALTLPTLPFWLACVFGAIPATYYLLLTIDYIRNWKPPTAQQQTVGAILSKISDLAGADRPYLVAFAVAGVAIANAIGYHIPDWIVMLLGAGGLISMHRIAQSPIVLDKPIIAPVIMTTKEESKP